MPTNDTPKALHDAVRNAFSSVKNCADILALATAVKTLDSPKDLAGSLRSIIANKASSNEAINGQLSPTEAAALVEAWYLIGPEPSNAGPRTTTTLRGPKLKPPISRYPIDPLQ